MEEFTTLISNVGFPIAAFCAMFYMCNNTIKENSAALVNINQTLASIYERLKKEEKEV
jgi:hypothetical protein